MASAIFSTDPHDAADMKNFLSATRDGFMFYSRYLARITIPKVLLGTHGEGHFDVGETFRDMMFMCESAEWAGRAFNTADARYYGPSFKLPTNSVYNDMTLTFLLRGEMYEKKLFDFWHNKINPNSIYDFEYRDNYATEISIYAFDEVGEATYQQSFVKAWPISVQPVQTRWADDAIARLNVVFTYLHYKTERDPEPVPNLNTLVSGAVSVNSDQASFFLGNQSFK